MMLHRYARLAVPVMLGLVVSFAPAAHATPNPNSAALNLRVFNDCPFSTLSTTNNYPGNIQISDFVPASTCFGFANLHAWSFSENGTDAAVFDNNACFTFGFNLVISGDGQGEAAARISPWWGKYTDGRINVRTTDGEIAVFGGRLPFYSFTGNGVPPYVKGTLIHLEMAYDPNQMTQADPGTFQYTVVYGGNSYSSPVLPVDQGNDAEDPPYGLWGMLNDGRVGGLLQVLWGPTNPLVDRTVTADFTDITFEKTCVEKKPTPTLNSTWGHLKVLYR
jgi:hypothetical protein